MYICKLCLLRLLLLSLSLCLFFCIHATWKIRRISPLLPHCCLIRAPREDIISERFTRGRKHGWMLAEKASACLCVSIWYRGRMGGGMAAFSSPITSEQALSQSQSQMQRELVSMEMTLEWCWCLLTAEEAARWAVGQAHTSGHTHTHCADITIRRQCCRWRTVWRRDRWIKQLDVDITGNCIMYIINPQKTHRFPWPGVIHTNRTATQISQ